MARTRKKQRAATSQPAPRQVALADLQSLYQAASPEVREQFDSWLLDESWGLREDVTWLNVLLNAARLKALKVLKDHHPEREAGRNAELVRLHEKEKRSYGQLAMDFDMEPAAVAKVIQRARQKHETGKHKAL
jgi:hypothetical protein